MEMRWQEDLIPEHGYNNKSTYRWRKLTHEQYNKLTEFQKELYHEWLSQTNNYNLMREPDKAEYQFFYDIEVNGAIEVTPIGLEIDV